jgi:glycosyltransferase involved in cell wall biosynthesis
MRLLINTASTFAGGGVQVAKSFIEECTALSDHDYGVIVGEALAKLIDAKKFPSNFTFYFIDYRPATRVFSWKSRTKFFKHVEQTFKPDVVFTTSGPAYWRPTCPHIMGYNLPHYVYKDSPFFKTLSVARRLFWWGKEQVVRYFLKQDADAYVVQTEDIACRLKRWLPTDAVYTVSNTYSSIYQQRERWQPVALKKNVSSKRVLVLSAYYKHKNLEVINSLAALLEERNEKLTFVLTLPTDVLVQIFSPVTLRYIENAGPVTPEQCPSLYQQCDVVFLPTLLECFSANYAEAMVMEKPIVTSDLGFAHTVCGEAALYIDPMNAEKILDAFRRVLNDEELTKKLIDSGKRRLKSYTTAQKRANEYLRICRELIHNSK